MSGDRPFEVTDAADLSTGSVPAPACPVGRTVTWGHLLISSASVVLFTTLLVGAATRDPASIVGAGLAVVGLTASSFASLGILRTWTSHSR